MAKCSCKVVKGQAQLERDFIFLLRNKNTVILQTIAAFFAHFNQYYKQGYDCAEQVQSVFSDSILLGTITLSISVLEFS